jgi:peptidyl-prolyl cis-trans isomerase SurA
VNGEPITAIDVAQRMKLLQISGNKSATRKEALDDLIDEILKLETANRYRMDITDAQVDATLGTMAGRMRASTDKFLEVLRHAGISPTSFKRKIRADIAWGEIVRGKFQARLQVRDADVSNVLQENKEGQTIAAYEYTLRPILFVTPTSAPVPMVEARRREAEGLRTRFENCDSGLRIARALRDVAVREPLMRNSADLSAKLREVLDNTALGHLTPPDVTPQGIEVFAVCDKKATKGENAASHDVRQKLFGQKFEAEGKQYLQKLRHTAMIEYK